MARINYSCAADLNMDPRRLVELTDSADAPGVPDASVIASTGDDADDLIDAYLAGKYVTPLVAPVGVAFPAIIRLISRDLHRLLLYQHRESVEAPKTVMAGADKAMKTLEQLAANDGDMILQGMPLVRGATSPSTSDGIIDTGCDPRRKFGRHKDRLGS